MKISIVFVLCLCVLLVAARPGGKKDKGKRKGGGGKHDRGHQGGRPNGGGHPGGRPDSGRHPGGRPDGQGHHDRRTGGHGHSDRRPGDTGHRGDRPDGRGHQDGRDRPGHGRGGSGYDGSADPRCENVNCSKPDRDSYVCGTDGETYRSECYLLKDRCKNKIAFDVEVAFQGRCQHPAEAGEPHGHPGPGRHTPGHHHDHHRHPGGKTPRGGRPGGKTPRGWRPGGRTPGGRRPGGKTPRGDYPPRWWPRECWDLMTTMEPDTVTVPDYEVDFGAPQEGSVCTATCPITTPVNPQTVCGTNGRTYESPCILDLVACVTDNSELSVASEGPCQ